MTRSPASIRLFVTIVTAVAGAGIINAASAIAQTAPPPNPQGTIRAQGQEVEQDKNKPAAVTPTAQFVDGRGQMRSLVSDISRTARKLNPNFVVLVQDGLDLIEQTDAGDATQKVASSPFIRAIDGVLIRGMFFRPPTPKVDTPFSRTHEKTTAELLRLANLAKTRGLTILTTDFTVGSKMTQEYIKSSGDRGFIPFAASVRGFFFDAIPKFPNRPRNENPKSITGLGQIKNYLYLTNSSAYDRQEEFVLALADTNYDAVIVDVLHRGRRPFTKRSVDGMKFKKLGSRRLVLAYMNVGNAETFRYYWQPTWREGSPGFVMSPVPGNPDRHFVEYWNPEWKKIIAGDTKSYLYGIFAQGYDGVVLDGLEAFRQFEDGQ
ncbi:MAG: hypothetical protein O3A84_12470 [Proteobacteria bacterium]|nr:hypothetical protein [Pseudomonadota bacterium]